MEQQTLDRAESLSSEEAELSELMDRVMAAPIGPLRDQLLAMDDRIQKMEASLGKAAVGLAQIQEEVSRLARQMKLVVQDVRDELDQGLSRQTGAIQLPLDRLTARVEELATAIAHEIAVADRRTAGLHQSLSERIGPVPLRLDELSNQLVEFAKQQEVSMGELRQDLTAAASMQIVEVRSELLERLAAVDRRQARYFLYATGIALVAVAAGCAVILLPDLFNLMSIG